MAKTDDKVIKLMADVKRRKEEIAEAEKPNFTTNMSFSFVPGESRPMNLRVEKSVAKLVEIAGFLVSQQVLFANGAKVLGLTSQETPEFLWDGFRPEDWLKDIKTLLNKLQITNKKKQLAALEARLDKIVSPELRAEMELAEIEKELGQS